ASAVLNASFMVQTATPLVDDVERAAGGADDDAGRFVRVDHTVDVGARLQDAGVEVEARGREAQARVAQNVAVEVDGRERRCGHLLPRQPGRVHQQRICARDAQRDV